MPYGRGQLWVDGRMVTAYRLAYEWWIGPIPDGWTIDHIECDNPGCVNPQHLKACTAKDNIRRAALRKTHCPRGHPYSGPNARIYINSAGITRRVCRACAVIGTTTYKRRKQMAE